MRFTVKAESTAKQSPEALSQGCRSRRVFGIAAPAQTEVSQSKEVASFPATLVFFSATSSCRGCHHCSVQGWHHTYNKGVSWAASFTFTPASLGSRESSKGSDPSASFRRTTFSSKFEDNNTKMLSPAIVLGLRGVQVLFSIIVLGLTAYRTFDLSTENVYSLTNLSC